VPQEIHVTRKHDIGSVRFNLCVNDVHFGDDANHAQPLLNQPFVQVLSDLQMSPQGCFKRNSTQPRNCFISLHPTAHHHSLPAAISWTCQLQIGPKLIVKSDGSFCGCDGHNYVAL
jgi:hypothetical protein